MANNNLPGWKDAPEWAMWRAVDKSGKVYFFEKIPRISEVEDLWISAIGGDVEFAGYTDATDWQNSLERRPENTPPTPEELDQICGPEYELWQYLHNELGVIALNGQLGDIMDIVRRIDKQKE